MAAIFDKEKEKLLSNKWLQSFAKDLNLNCNCSNCRLYNRAKCHCKFDDSIIDNPNVLDTYCEWWVPEEWILDKYKKKYTHFRMWGIDWVKDTTDLRRRKEWLKKHEGGEKIIEFCDKPVPVNNTDSSSNALPTGEQYCNQTPNKNSENDKKYTKKHRKCSKTLKRTLICGLIKFYRFMNMRFFTKSKKIVRYDTEGMTNDFNYVKHIVETTVNPSQFPALNNLINAFANKWKPVYPQKLSNYDYPVEEHNQEYEDAVNYLRLKMNYEYEMTV